MFKDLNLEFNNAQIIEHPYNKNDLSKITCFSDKDRKHKIYFLNSDGEIVAKFETAYNTIEQLSEKSENYFIELNMTNKSHKIVDKDYKTIIEMEDIELGIEDGLFAIKKDGLWGFIDYKANIIIPCQYRDYCSFSNGYAGVLKNSKWGLINKNNKLVIPYKYENDNFYFNNGVIPAKLNDKWGYIDINDNVIIPFVYDNAITSYNNATIFAVKKASKWGFIDKNNNTVIPFIYDDIETTEDEFLILVKNNKKGLVNSITGEIITSTKFDEVGYFNKDTAIIRKNNKFGLIDKTGKIILKPTYDFIDEFCNYDCYMVENDHKCGFIDETGKIIIPIEYSKNHSQTPFVNGFALMYKELENGYNSLMLDKNLNVVHQTTGKIKYLANGLYLIPKNQYGCDYKLVKLMPNEVQ